MFESIIVLWNDILPRRLLSRFSLSYLDGELSDASVISLSDLLSIILQGQYTHTDLVTETKKELK